MQPRLDRERRTVAAMIRLFCRAQHGGGPELCAACADLLRYTEARLAHCPFHAEKPACAYCPVHCYAPKQREQIRTVMRFTGPRMLWRHPVRALWHLLYSRRTPRSKPRA
jgi:hypothetical protein